jgi:salicylate hydroxylase
MLVPAAKILAEPDLKDLGLLEPRITIIHDNERRIICYPCRDSSLLNFVCALREYINTVISMQLGIDLYLTTADSELNEISEETWTARGSTESLVKSFDTFSPTWQKLLSLGEKPGLWQLRDQDPLPQWVKGKAVIIGDAAHPSE